MQLTNIRYLPKMMQQYTLVKQIQGEQYTLVEQKFLFGTICHLGTSIFLDTWTKILGIRILTQVYRFMSFTK